MTEQHIIELLQQVGLDLKEDRDMHEVLTAHLGIVAQHLGYEVELRLPHGLLPELPSAPSQKALLAPALAAAHHVRVEAGDDSRAALYGALLDLMQVAPVLVFRSDEFRPSLSDLLTVTGAGHAAIALVTGLEYYGIAEDWWHALTLVRRPGRRLRVYDGLAPVGSVLFDRWDERLAKASRFDWSRWTGELLVLRR